MTTKLVTLVREALGSLVTQEFNPDNPNCVDGRDYKLSNGGNVWCLENRVACPYAKPAGRICIVQNADGLPVGYTQTVCTKYGSILDN